MLCLCCRRAAESSVCLQWCGVCIVVSLAEGSAGKALGWRTGAAQLVDTATWIWSRWGTSQVLQTQNFDKNKGNKFNVCFCLFMRVGTSSILAGAALAAVYRCTGRSYDTTSLIHDVLYLEQILTTGMLNPWHVLLTNRKHWKMYFWVVL